MTRAAELKESRAVVAEDRRMANVRHAQQATQLREKMVGTRWECSPHHPTHVNRSWNPRKQSSDVGERFFPSPYAMVTHLLKSERELFVDTHKRNIAMARTLAVRGSTASLPSFSTQLPKIGRPATAA